MVTLVATGLQAAVVRPLKVGAELVNGAAQQDQDSIAVIRYLSNRQCTAWKIVRGNLGRFVVVTERSRGCRWQLMVLRVDADSVASLQPPSALSVSEPDTMYWKGLRGLTGPALVISYDNTLENIVGTSVYGDTGGGFVPLFSDPQGTCAPAELRGGDGDGELISWHEDPSNGYCSSPCHQDVLNHFNMPPAWAQVDDWNGRRWVLSTQHHRAFYASLARTYRAMDSWIRDSTAAPMCAGVFWLQDHAPFQQWAARSDSIARE